MKIEALRTWFVTIFALLGLLAFPAEALVVTGYDAVTNNRFAPEGSYTNTLTDPGYNIVPNTNPAFIGSGYDFSGVGWRDGSDTNSGSLPVDLLKFGITLLNPGWALVANHAAGFPGDTNNFLGSDGQVVKTVRGAMANVSGTDLSIVPISPYMSPSKFTNYRVMDLGANPANYAGSPLIMYGWYSKVGTNYVTSANSSYFYYSSATNAPGMAYVESGDSGSPDFIPYVDPITGGKKISVLGAHFGYGVDPFLPAYWTNLNAFMNPTGYALKWTAPVAQTWTGGAGSGDFTNNANWSSAMPGISNAVLFDVGTAGGQTVINLGGTQTLNGLYFKNSGGNGFTISNGLLALDRVGIVNGSNGTLVIQSGVAFNAPQNWDGGNGGIVVNGTITNNGQLFYLEGTGTNWLNGAVWGNGGLAKDGPGVLMLNGSNQFQGTLFVHDGTVDLTARDTSVGGLYSEGGTIKNGNILRVQGNLAKDTPGTLVMTGTNMVSGQGIISNGTLVLSGAQSLTSFGSLYGAAGVISNESTMLVTGMVTKSTSGTLELSGTNLLTGSGSFIVDGTVLQNRGVTAMNGMQVGVAGSSGVVYNASIVMNGGSMYSTNAGSAFLLAAGAGNVAQFYLSNGFVRMEEVRVGSGVGTQGAWIQSGGTNSIMAGQTFHVSYYSNGATGQLVMAGGLMVGEANSTLAVGAGGVGKMVVSNGMVRPQNFSVGSYYYATNAYGVGNVEVDGGSLVTDVNAILGVGNTNYGKITVNGGQFMVTNASQNVQLGVGIASTGILLLSNGLTTVTEMRVGAGAGGSGLLQVDGGSSNTILGNLYLGYASGCTGLVTVANTGQLELLGGIINNAGAFGAITNQNGGILRFTGQNDPTITLNNGSSFVVTNAVVEFKNASAVNLQGNITNITFQAGSHLRFNGATNAALASYAVGSGSAFAGVDLVGSNATWRGGSLVVRLGGTLNVSNAADATVGAALTATGDIRVVNSRVTYQSNVVVSGRYFSDPSTNIFATNVTVTASGALNGSNGDLFVFQQNFTMQSTNRTDYNLALASVLFTNALAGPTNHVFDLSGSGAVDMGSSWLTAAQLATNFSIGTLSLAGGNSLTLNGVLLSNALSVGWLDLGGSTNNITSRLGLNVNLYYDLNNPNNAYLAGQTYALGAGQLIPVPEPNVLAMMFAAGVLFASFLRVRCAVRRSTMDGAEG